MDSANKIISFVLGLVVVVLFFAVITGRINLGKLSFLPLASRTASGSSATVTPGSATATTTVRPTRVVTGNYQQALTKTPTYGSYASTNKTQKIPSTGVPTLLLPLAFFALGGGIFLKGKK